MLRANWKQAQDLLDKKSGRSRLSVRRSSPTRRPSNHLKNVDRRPPLAAFFIALSLLLIDPCSFL